MGRGQASPQKSGSRVGECGLCDAKGIVRAIVGGQDGAQGVSFVSHKAGGGGGAAKSFQSSGGGVGRDVGRSEKSWENGLKLSESSACPVPVLKITERILHG